MQTIDETDFRFLERADVRRAKRFVEAAGTAHALDDFEHGQELEHVKWFVAESGGAAHALGSLILLAAVRLYLEDDADESACQVASTILFDQEGETDVARLLTTLKRLTSGGWPTL
jgi:hypothetical protein